MATHQLRHETELDNRLSTRWAIKYNEDKTELHLPLGINLGNNELKIFTHSSILPGNTLGLVSCMAITNQTDILSNGNTVVYELVSSKSKAAKPGQRYVFGRGAYLLNGIEVGARDGSKAEFQKEFALAAFAMIAHKNRKLDCVERIVSPLVVSSPYEGYVSEELEKTLVGVHVIKVDGNRELTIEIPSVKTYVEGKASGFVIQNTELNPDGTMQNINGTILIDLGNGDVQFTYTSPQGYFAGEGMHRGDGVRRVFNQLAQCQAVQKSTREKVHYLNVKDAVERNNLKIDLGINGEIDLKKDYDKALTDFVKKVEEKLRQWVSESSRRGVQASARYYVIGGGAKLPGLKEQLNPKLEIYTAIDPKYLEAYSLTLLANQKAKKA